VKTGVFAVDASACFTGRTTLLPITGIAMLRVSAFDPKRTFL